MNRSYQGQKARSNGKHFESMIDAGCQHYAKIGYAVIHKTPEPMRPISGGQNGRYLAVYDRKAQPDYQGTVRGGRSVVFEAKHSDGNQISQGRITTAQWVDLDAHLSLGAWCYVLISFGFQIFSLIPWTQWRDMKNQVGRLYLKPTDELVEVYRVKAIAGKVLFFDRYINQGYIK